MKICFKYGDRVICLPSKAVAERLSEASREELCVLLMLAADPDTPSDVVCEKLDISTDDFMKAVSFWRGSGALGVTLEEGEKLPSGRKKSEKSKKTDTVEEEPAEAPEEKKQKEEAKKHA